MSSFAWPFIVMRNSTLDWRAIYSPRFLVEDHNDFVLVLETAVVAHQSTLTLRPVLVGGQDLLIVFRSQTIDHFAPDLKGSDRFGRPIHVVEGLVANREDGIDIGVAEATLDAGCTDVSAIVRAFWHEMDEGAPPKFSAAVNMGRQA